jgi:hypothetical protein
VIHPSRVRSWSDYLQRAKPADRQVALELRALVGERIKVAQWFIGDAGIHAARALELLRDEPGTLSALKTDLLAFDEILRGANPLSYRYDLLEFLRGWGAGSCVCCGEFLGGYKSFGACGEYANCNATLEALRNGTTPPLHPAFAQ